jgi:TRAP-type uncharacterized transport system fused permease subunit
LLGQFRGGPAKAAVVSSGMTGMISGSSVANVVTTGTFTIPLMKRVGYTPVQAGAIECAAGVNGQLMPPVMGAAAFLMAEYVGITYADVVRHALLPAIITYGALFYIVDIEAMKKGMTGLPRQRRQHGLLARRQGFSAPGQQRLKNEGEGGVAVCQQPLPLVQGAADAVGRAGQALLRGRQRLGGWRRGRGRGQGLADAPPKRLSAGGWPDWPPR